MHLAKDQQKSQITKPTWYHSDDEVCVDQHGNMMIAMKKGQLVIFLPQNEEHLDKKEKGFVRSVA